MSGARHFSAGERHSVALAPGVTMDFRFIPPGKFRMGRRSGGSEFGDEWQEPVHEVRFLGGFWLGETPVTQEQFARWSATHDPDHRNELPGHPDHPAENMTWWQAVQFCQWLSEYMRAGNLLPAGASIACLPTQAEWEYACRAGTGTDYHSGEGEAALSEVGRFGRDFAEGTRPVRRGTPNAWGLFDLHGHVWQWCHDVWGASYDETLPVYRQQLADDPDPGARDRAADYPSASRWQALLEDRRQRVVRGGSWGNAASGCRSACRDWGRPDMRDRTMGFRLCLAPGPAIAEVSADKTAEPTKTEKEQAEAAGGGGRRRPGRPESNAPDAAGAGDKGAGHDLARERITPPEKNFNLSDSSSKHPAPMTLPPEPPFLVNDDRVIDGPKFEEGQPLDWHAYRSRPVQKIVLGQLGDEASKNPLALGALPANFAELFPKLTHLYLWNCAGFTTLPKLPVGLECLDLRGSVDLQTVPGLPATLETLDVARCPRLTALLPAALPNLRWFYVEGCESLDPDDVNQVLRQAVALEEFSAADCPQFLSLRLPKQDSGSLAFPGGHPLFPECRLKKLVLKNCTKLQALPDLRTYPWLHHLNIAGCSELRDLPALPVTELPDGQPSGVRTLYLHGCEQLSSFLGLDVRGVHRGSDSEDNVARLFRTMSRMAGEPGELRMAKVLLLGSGRCGKTTIARAFKWAAMNEAARKEHPEHHPKTPQMPTENICFDRVETDFRFAGRKEKGAVHLWDFGGQEIYHNTHRLFASQGTVFVIAITTPKEHERRIEEELRRKDPRVRDRFREQNEYRELKYWFDYLRNALGIATLEDFAAALDARAPIDRRVLVRVVCTGTNQQNLSEALQVLRDQAGPYASLLRIENAIGVDFVDFKEEKFDQPAEAFGSLQSWMESAIGEAAEQFGIRVPEVFLKLAQSVERDLANKRAAKVLEWSSWLSRVGKELSGRPSDRTVEEAAHAVAQYLHHCGRLFWLRKGHDRGRVIVNQQWGIDLIYSLTRQREGEEIERIRALTARFFTADDLKTILEDYPVTFAEVIKEENWPVFLDLVDQCDICARLGDRWMAIDRDLLREATLPIRKELLDIWTEGRSGPESAWVNHSFALHGDQGGLLGQSDYRAVLAFVVRNLEDAVPRILFGDDEDPAPSQLDRARRSNVEHRCWFWNDGFMVELTRSANRAEELPEKLLLRIEWSPTHSPGSVQRRAFEGGLLVELLSADESIYGKRLLELLWGKNGPLSFFADKIEPHDFRDPELPQDLRMFPRGWGQPGWLRRAGKISDFKDIEFEVALSYRGTSEEVELAGKIAAALAQAKIGCFHYSENQRKLTKEEDADSAKFTVSEIYDILSKARVLIAIPSRSYFDSPEKEAATCDDRGRPLDQTAAHPPAQYLVWQGNTPNRYCPVELAEAVLAHAESSRPAHRFFWAAGPRALSRSDVEGKVGDVVRAFRVQVAAHRLGKGTSSAIEDREILSSASCTDEKIKAFVSDAGRSKFQYLGVKNDTDIAALVNAVRTALASD